MSLSTRKSSLKNALRKFSPDHGLSNNLLKSANCYVRFIDKPQKKKKTLQNETFESSNSLPDLSKRRLLCLIASVNQQWAKAFEELFLAETFFLVK